MLTFWGERDFNEVFFHTVNPNRPPNNQFMNSRR